MRWVATLPAALAMCATLFATPAAAAGAALAAAPVYVGLDLEQRDTSSTSDESIEFGARRAVEEINARGGVLRGRPLELVVRDNRTVPARGIANIREFANMPDLVAFLTGKFSPVALEQAKVLPGLQLIMLDPWAAANEIVDNGQQPNWAFRLSLNDTMAVNAMLRRARDKGYARIGAILPNMGWGRSNLKALESALRQRTDQRQVGIEWYSLGGEPVLLDRYHALRNAGAQAIYLVANEREGAQLLREMQTLPPAERRPILSHWGVTGGNFPRMAGQALFEQDFAVIQTFGFERAATGRARVLAEAAMQKFGVDDPAAIPSPQGIAHAYDLVHLLAMAVEAAGSTDRAAVRAALERLPAYKGVVKHLTVPYTRQRHEALAESDLYFARYRANGRLERAP